MREKEIERECVCVRVCVYVSVREKARESGKCALIYQEQEYRGIVVEC